MQVAAETKREATYQDVLDAPEHMVAELIDGQLYLSPRPASRHANAAGGIFERIRGQYGRSGGNGDGPGGWWIMFGPELHFGRDVLVPDIAGWRREHMPVIPDVAAFALTPDWVCEVVSPSTVRLDLVYKRNVYAQQQVGHLWLVDPRRRSLEVLRLAGQHWLVAASFVGNERVRAEPFDAVELDMSDWWLPEEPTPEVGGGS